VVRISIQIANNPIGFIVREGLELFHEWEVVHIFKNRGAMVKRVTLHKSGNITEIIKVLNDVINVRVGLSAYIWQHKP